MSGEGSAHEPTTVRWQKGPQDARRRVADANEWGGQLWTIGRPADVEWIQRGITHDCTITSAIPPVFDAYATIVELRRFGRDDDDVLPEAQLVEILRGFGSSKWWLGYLDTGCDDVVFPLAESVSLYADWPYIVAQAGPDQALSWRHGLPDLIFPVDRSWLVSTLWDDTWTCVGGSEALLAAVQSEAALEHRSVRPGDHVAPPGHRCI